MHDFILAKEIIDALNGISAERGLNKIKKVKVEIGAISLAHDGQVEHTEDISLENLKFGLESVSRGTPLEGVAFAIKKIDGQSWKITEIEV